eukprot:COSAG02_NODE_193_length_29843_cov_30.519903_22_plen_114_part_00
MHRIMRTVLYCVWIVCMHAGTVARAASTAALARMAVTYKTAEEAYATRQRLWESRQQEVDRVDVVSDLERFMFGMLFPTTPLTAPFRKLQSYSYPAPNRSVPSVVSAEGVKPQ